MKLSFIIKLLLLVAPLAVIILCTFYLLKQTGSSNASGASKAYASGFLALGGYAAAILYLIIYEIGMFIHFIYLSKRNLKTKEDVIFLLIAGIILLFMIG